MKFRLLSQVICSNVRNHPSPTVSISATASGIKDPYDRTGKSRPAAAGARSALQSHEWSHSGSSVRRPIPSSQARTSMDDFLEDDVHEFSVYFYSNSSRNRHCTATTRFLLLHAEVIAFQFQRRCKQGIRIPPDVCKRLR